MSQLIENKQSSLEEILEKLRYQALSMPHSPTSVRYLRALESLESTVIGTHGSSLRTPSNERAAGLSQGETVGIPESGPHTAATAAETEPLAPILQLCCTDWLVNQWLLRVPFSTASLYLDIISSLYGSAVRDGQLPPTDLFTNLKAQLKTLGPEGWSKGIDDEIFARALRLTRNASLLISDDAIAADLVLWSLTHGLLPLTTISLLKREDLEEATPALREIREAIIDRHCTNARRKYIFPLRQSERTPRQLSRHIAKIVNALFRRVRLPQSTDPSQTVEALWAYAALRSGLPASQIVTYLGHAPLGLPVLKLSVVSCQLSESGQTVSNTARSAHTSYCGSAADTFKENFAQVGKIFLENPPRWYAMSLRPGVRFTQVCRRIQLLSQTHTAATAAHTSYRGSAADTAFSALQLFYPSEEIARAIGKKIVIRQRPFIHSVVFFRAKLTDIGRLFARIGDIAWCYRQSARPGAPYADISESQFRQFQQTIASFTPDYEVAPTGELELKKNDRVQILGGLFAGHEATFDSAAHVTEASGLRPQSVTRAAGLSKVKSESGAEASKLKTQASDTAQSADTSYREADTPKDTAAKAADTPTTVYRLNIIGDNGIEWRIHVDPRLTAPSSPQP